MLAVIIKIAVSYLLGSVSGSLLLGRFRGVDIRQQGSGNAGGTNALRTQGKLFALAVIIIDIGKGALAAGLVALAFAAQSEISVSMLMAVCGLAAVAGHIWPVFFGFRGGKGAGTVVGVLAVMAPVVMVCMIGIWLVVLVLSGYVGLATMLAGISIPVFMVLFGLTDSGFLLFGVTVALLMLWTHRSNIQRLLQGAENRFERVRINRWWR